MYPEEIIHEAAARLLLELRIKSAVSTALKSYLNEVRYIATGVDKYNGRVQRDWRMANQQQPIKNN